MFIFRPDDFNVDYDPTEVKRRHHSRGELRHAMSEILPNDFQFAAQRKRSQTMEIAKEHAYSRLQSELNKAQEVNLLYLFYFESVYY